MSTVGPSVVAFVVFHCYVPVPFSVGDKQPMILKWRILSATNDLDRVSAVALPKLPISLTNTDLKVASDTQFYPGLGTAGSDLGAGVLGPWEPPGLESVPGKQVAPLSGSQGSKGCEAG